ncbi:MAG: hypothetical protein FWF41_09635 [Betaproteobacteria bacterium]|nr:hypothetical protein [Betaproteobacteria bacterium]
MQRKGWRSTAALAVVLSAVLAATLTACGGSRLSNEKDDTGIAVEMPGGSKPMRGLEALLYAKGGSSAQGKIMVVQSGDRWRLSITIFGLPPSSTYRLAFFDNGNCSSPNAFSAGKLWPPPGTPEGTRLDRWIPTFSASQGGSIDAVTSLPNPSEQNESVFRKRSVLVFAGIDVQELKPSVRNDVVACGVFDTIQTLF